MSVHDRLATSTQHVATGSLFDCRRVVAVSQRVETMSLHFHSYEMVDNMTSFYFKFKRIISYWPKQLIDIIISVYNLETARSIF